MLNVGGTLTHRRELSKKVLGLQGQTQATLWLCAWAKSQQLTKVNYRSKVYFCTKFVIWIWML